MSSEHQLRPIAEEALAMVRDNDRVGLGSGRAATAFVAALGNAVREGLRVVGVPTSEATAQGARQHGIPLGSLDELASLDLAVDGADEVDPQLNLIKGWGGALVREKIVAAAAKRLVILVTPEKLVPKLGTRGKLPVEVVPFGYAPCGRRLNRLGLAPELRLDGDRPLVTDNGNYILDCGLEAIDDPAALDAAIRAIPGVVGSGLFLAMADIVLVGGAAVERLERR